MPLEAIIIHDIR